MKAWGKQSGGQAFSSIKGKTNSKSRRVNYAFMEKSQEVKMELLQAIFQFAFVK